jgi:uncharacterized protein (DUF1800 family)
MAADLHAGFIALNRFGLGSRRGGDLAAAASDPRGFLRAELEQPGIAALEARTAVALKILFTDQEQQRLQRLAADMTIQTASLEESPGRRAHRRRQNRKGAEAAAAGNPASLPHRSVGAAAAYSRSTTRFRRAARSVLD